MIQSYTGPYVVEPTEAGKMLSTARRTLRQNVIVSPVSPKFVGSGVRRKAATAITPTEREQIAVPKDTYTTGDVKVKAIPSDYIGADVPRKSSSEMSASGPTVTAPAGYYDEDASKAVTNATWKSASTVGVVPEITVSSSGLITANCAGWTSIHPLTASGYADADTAANIQLAGVKTKQLDTLGATTYTPTKTGPQTIAAGKYLTGDQTIGAIPASYYDMSGDMAWLGAGAELVTTFTLTDVKLANTNYATWTPSTTASDILATRDAGTFVADMENYDYYLVWETKIPVVAPASATKKALPIFLAGLHVQNIVRRPGNFTQILDSNFTTAVSVNVFSANFFRYYGTTTGTATYTWSSSYGLYATATSATLSNSTSNSPTVTAKTPKISARCSTTYMSTTNAGLIDQTNTVISQKCYVYKVRKQTGFVRGAYERQIAMVNELTGN